MFSEMRSARQILHTHVNYPSSSKYRPANMLAQDHTPHLMELQVSSSNIHLLGQDRQDRTHQSFAMHRGIFSQETKPQSGYPNWTKSQRSKAIDHGSIGRCHDKEWLKIVVILNETARFRKAKELTSRGSPNAKHLSTTCELIRDEKAYAWWCHYSEGKWMVEPPILLILFISWGRLVNRMH